MPPELGNTGKLLINSDDLIADICSKAGFNTQEGFNRLFKK